MGLTDEIADVLLGPNQGEKKRQSANANRGVNPSPIVPAHSGFQGGSVTVNNSASAPVPVDTELPPAVALSDDQANPTAPAVGGFAMGYNGATWDRLRSSIANGLQADVTRSALPSGAATSANQYAQRPSEKAGRTHVAADAGAAITADTNIRTNTASKTLYVTELHFAAFNTNTAANGLVFIRDGSGGTIKRTFLMSPSGVAAQLAASAAVSITTTFPEPMQFTTGVYVDISTGTITAACGFVGYEE